MRWEKMYMSYASEDEAVAVLIARSLSRIGAEPYFPNRGSEVSAESNIKQLNDSNCFIPILTDNGFKSSFVNQELGYAIAKKNLGLFPFIEKSQPSHTISRSTEKIIFDADSMDDAIYNLICALRVYVGRNEFIEWVLGFVTIHCRRCDRCYTEPLPSLEDVKSAVEEEKLFYSDCKCNTTNYYSPKTFLVST